MAEEQREPLQHERFEELIRMATDNRVTAQNSWGVALIDYFYEMSWVRQDGEGVDFQKASSALDGCVRVYASRVDSAANETVRILAGLTSNTRVSLDDDVEDEEDNNDNNGDETTKGNTKRGSRRHRKDTQSTLFPRFDRFRMKDTERPTKADPIFKRSLAEFDEGGARSLLNNILSINSQGRVIFNTITENDDTVNWQKVNFNHFVEILKDDKSFGDLSDLNALLGGGISEIPKSDDGDLSIVSSSFLQCQKSFNEDVSMLPTPDDEINILEFNNIIDFDFTDFSTVCPSIESLKGISNGSMNITELAHNLESMPLINADLQYHTTDDTQDNINEIPTFDQIDAHSNSHVNNDDNDVDDPDASKRTHYSLFLDEDEYQGADESGSQPNLTLTRLFSENQSGTPIANEDYNLKDENLISLFDSLVNKSLSNKKPNVFWKIKELKKEMRHSSRYNNTLKDNTINTQHALTIKNKNNLEDDSDDGSSDQDINDQTILKHKEYINFIGGPSDEDFSKLELDDITTNETLIFAKPQYLSRTVLPIVTKNQLNKIFTLEDDCNFTAKRLAYLSLKPKQIVNNILTIGLNKFDDKNLKFIDKERDNLVANSTFFANKYHTDQSAHDSEINNNNILTDANFDDIPDFDVWDLEEPVLQQSNSQQSSSQWPMSQNGNLITFSKKSKKVDIRLLKTNIWQSIEDQIITTKKRHCHSQITKEHLKSDSDSDSSIEVSSSDDDLDPNSYLEKHATTELKFTDVVKAAVTKYSGETKVELSTSYCFISLLHLANEQGMILASTLLNDDIIIKK